MFMRTKLNTDIRYGEGICTLALLYVLIICATVVVLFNFNIIQVQSVYMKTVLWHFKKKH